MNKKNSREIMDPIMILKRDLLGTAVWITVALAAVVVLEVAQYSFL